jgi:hypothetical protein
MLRCNKLTRGKIKNLSDAEAVDANDDFAPIRRNDLDFSSFGGGSNVGKFYYNASRLFQGSPTDV